MINSSRALLFTLLLVSAPLAHAAGEALPEQLQQIESLQRRADKLAFGVPGANNYHVAKARTWLDMALSEYHENEGTGLVPAAIWQSEKLLDALEKKQTDISMDTPMQVPGSVAVRPDLWNRIAALKIHDKFSCGQRPIAEAEVHLVWAGHEKLESNWAHAQSYARSAEDLLSEAQTSINTCVAKLPAIETVTLSTDALFALNEATLEPSALWRLNRLADNINMDKTLEEIVLVGHADRLRSDGHQERNQLLSEQRAKSIKQYLIGKGVAANKIHASGVGSSQPLVECPTNTSKNEQVTCLQPNRRVEVTLRGTNR
jgi:outer membrane protein OmpA-like peptidoglycan-associated protein